MRLFFCSYYFPYFNISPLFLQVLGESLYISWKYLDYEEKYVLAKSKVESLFIENKSLKSQISALAEESKKDKERLKTLEKSLDSDKEFSKSKDK